MVYTLFCIELVLAFVLASVLLYRYGDCYRNHIIVTISVLTAWYFSFVIMFILPLDITSTVDRMCNSQINITSDTILENSPTFASMSTDSTNFTTVNPPARHCEKPWVYVPGHVFPNLWRVVYWTSQCLTWLIMPMMQSYSKAGDFTVKGKLKSALTDNAIYYGSYLFICGILLIYIALKGVSLEWQKVKAIASSASNTWGLFLLILLLGYALVEVPRSLWNNSKKNYTLMYSYFKVAKLSTEKCEAEETVDEILDTLKAMVTSVGVGHPLHRHVETIVQKVPVELRERMASRPAADERHQAPTLKSLVNLHKKTIKALHVLQRTETQWHLMLEKIFHLEDVAENLTSPKQPKFKRSFPSNRSALLRAVYPPLVEWYWECLLRSYFLKVMAVVTGVLSIAVVWSEVTFFSKKPVLSIFANIVDAAKVKYDHAVIVTMSTLVIAYMFYCAYSTVLKIRLLNLYYLAPHHQTNEYSLIFSGMMVCRLTPPMCLNFLSLIHMDSHVIKERIMETYYTQIMGHMDVLSLIADGFNVYFPMLVVLLCAATYFSLGSRLLSMCGFQQFIGDDELTSDLVDEGRQIVKREKRKRQRAEESLKRRSDFSERLAKYRTQRESGDGAPERPEARYQPGDSYQRGQQDLDNELDLRFGDSTLPSLDSRSRMTMPPRGLFDDV